MKKKQLAFLVLGAWVGLLLSPVGIAAGSLSQRITANFNRLPPGAHWGLWVKDLTTGKRLYERRGREFFTPASTMKLVTASAAADALPAGFRFRTRLGWRGQVKNGELQGDLYLHMSGDPTLKTRDLTHLITRLKKRGIRSITGRLVIDTSRFQMVPYGPGWMWDELSYNYAAPMGSIVLNENKFGIKVKALRDRIKPSVTVSVPRGVVTVSNHVRVTAKYDKWCPLTVYSNDNNNYRLGGCLVRSWGPQVRVLAIRNTWPFFKAELHKVLKKQGVIARHGIVRENSLPKVQWQITHASASLPSLTKKMLKESNNLIADALFVELGRRYSRHGGNWQGGALAVRHFLQSKVKINTKQISIEDGSGVSRYNLIRPIQLAQLLIYIRKHPKLYRIIYPALPISGKDGTLIWRLRHSFGLSRVHAKTGTMTGVSTLAGYIKRKDGHQLAFSIMMNSWIGKLKQWRAAEDKLLLMLAAGK
jgi:D-alanyl-D-alanine carboxypeptidase/D-alanyl-D-alanine-endopeptidase (penicillin-binding protein 4)